jgi:hypothetical protein
MTALASGCPVLESMGVRFVKSLISTHLRGGSPVSPLLAHTLQIRGVGGTLFFENGL